MTEQTTSVGGTAVASPPVAPPLAPEFEETADNANRKKLLAVGAAVGVLVLLIAAFFLMKGGDSTDTAMGVPPSLPTSTDGGAKAPAADKPVTLPKTYKNAVGRDPFKALYVAPAAKAPSEPVDSPDTGSDTSVPPVVSVPPTDTTSGSSTDTSAPPSASYAPVWIALESVQGTKSATFLVGYSNGKKAKQVRFDDILAPTRTLQTQFASVFALLSIQDGTVTVQFGDATPFDLAPGFGNRHFVG